MPADSRRYPRLPLQYPVKLAQGAGGRYLTGRTCNMSAGGVFLELQHGTRLSPGARVRLGIARTPRQILLAPDALVDATILRSFGHGATQYLAVQFDTPQSLALAA